MLVFGQEVLYMQYWSPLSQGLPTCTIDRVANMYPNEGDGPSIFSTPSRFTTASHGWSKLRYLNTA